MKNTIKKILAIIICLSLLVPFCTVTTHALNPYEVANQKYSVLQEIIKLYTEVSLYETDADTLISQMIYNYIAENPYVFPALVNAMLSSNDKYSAYYTSDYGYLATSSKSFGIILKDSLAYNDNVERKNGVYIDEVLADSNAEFAGILPGDRFISIEGINVEGLTLEAIKKLLSMLPLTSKPAEESEYYEKFKSVDVIPEDYMLYKNLDWDFTKEVSMVFERILSDGSVCNMSVSLPRGMATSKEVWFDMTKETQTALIQITSFHQDSTFENFKAATENAIAEGCNNLIIDLRDNGGGYSEIAIKIAEMFAPKGTTMFYTRQRDQEPVPTVAEGDLYIADKFEKIIILVNASTASAAELLAYILEEQAGAAIIGETTYGKALAQNSYTLTNGDIFTITSMEILTTDLASYNELGLEPTVYVPQVPKKFEFPQNLSTFNYINFAEIEPGKTNDPTLALEQRLHLLGILREENVDGLCDSATESAIFTYQFLTNEPEPTGTLTQTTVANITESVNFYKDTYMYEDSQLAVAKLYIKNKSQGKRLASEYIQALKKYNKMLEEREAANLAELEKLYKEEAEKNMQEGNG